MKYVLFFALVFSAFTLASVSPAQAAKSAKAKSEPAPIPDEDRVGSDDDENSPGSFEETYEGNDRGGNGFDEGYDDGSMGGELFSLSSSAKTKSIKTVTEDRGEIVVITTTRMREAYPEDTCSFLTVQVIEKKTGKLLGSDTIRSCEDQIL